MLSCVLRPLIFLLQMTDEKNIVVPVWNDAGDVI